MAKMLYEHSQPFRTTKRNTDLEEMRGWDDRCSGHNATVHMSDRRMCRVGGLVYMSKKPRGSLWRGKQSPAEADHGCYYDY